MDRLARRAAHALAVNREEPRRVGVGARAARAAVGVDVARKVLSMHVES